MTETLECPHTHHRPENFGPLFEKMKSLGFVYGQIDQALAKFDDNELLPLIEDLRTLFPIWQYEAPAIQSPYSFLANSGLSGLRGDPKAFIRLPPLDSLARFAVLYADTVFIQEPLSQARYSRSGFPIMRDNVAIELAILVALQPLLEAGIVKIARNNFPMFGADSEEFGRQIWH